VAETREINDGLGALVLLNMADAHGGNKAGACERGVSTAAADSFERPRNFAARAAGSYDRRRATPLARWSLNASHRGAPHDRVQLRNKSFLPGPAGLAGQWHDFPPMIVG
jgi:hypothetical protein